MNNVFIVDAFVTTVPFSGNPAGVCLLDEWMSDQWMQCVAAEFKHSYLILLQIVWESSQAFLLII